jgi:hypothetical protein
LPSSAATLPYEANDSISIDDNLLQQLANGTSRALHFFDAYTSMIDIKFYDAIPNLPEHYYSCFNHYDQQTDLFFNKYQETCTDTYYDTLPTYVPFARFVDNHLSSIDLLLQYRVLVSIMKDSPTRYSAVPKGTLSYKRILLQARGLKAQFFNYDDHLTTPLLEPFIYTSSNPSELPIVIDTGASCSITPVISDFNDKLEKPDIPGLNQLTGQATVVGQGNITWKVEDMYGTKRDISTKAYYVPSASIRLFSPQVYIGNNSTAQLVLDRTGAKFRLKCGTDLRFPLNNSSNLPFMLTTAALNQNRRKQQRNHFVSFQLYGSIPQQSPLIHFGTDATSLSAYTSLTTRSVIHRDNFNLHPFQRELLLWHCRLGHADLQRIQSILSRPSQPKGSSNRGELFRQLVTPSFQGASSCCLPQCEACQYAKQKRVTPTNPKHPSSNYEEGVLSRNQLHPGDRVSCDQYMSTTHGRLIHTHGKEDKSNQLVGETIFVDHATNYIFHRHQVNLTAATSVHSKHACEDHFLQHGVRICHYVSDNHPFSSKVWVNDCAVQNQQRSLSGVGAHHQNYMERHIQTIFNWSRASLLHFVLHWPQQASETLWPFAVDHSVYLWNSLPARHIRLSPKEILADSCYFNHHHLQRSHVFGCPVFVLDPRLQDAKSIPKWSMRSRRGIYLGVSPFHSSTVHLVLNPTTGAITPQYHVVFDDTFSTVFSDGQFDELKWTSLLTTGYERNAILSPDSEGHIHVPPDATSFDSSPTSSSEGETSSSDSIPLPLKSLSLPPDTPMTSVTPDSTLSSPVASLPLSSPEGASSETRRVTFDPTLSSSEGAPSPSLPPSPPPSPVPLRRSTRSTSGQAPERLTMLSLYYSTNQIQRPRFPRSSQINFTLDTSNKAPRIAGERLHNAHLASLCWSSLLEACTTKLGLKQSPRIYFLHMKGKLEKLGFIQSTADPCLFISATVICLCYVDDALLVYRDVHAVDDLTARMKDEKMLFNVESDVAGYLGVLIDRRADGSIVMRQEGLAKRIISALFMDDNSVTSLRTPANAFLPIDEEDDLTS